MRLGRARVIVSFFNSPLARSYLPLVVLAILLVFGLRALYNVMAETEDDEEPDEPKDLLWEFEKARAAGELSETEFQKIKASLLGGGPGKMSARPQTTAPAHSNVTAVAPPPVEPLAAAIPGSSLDEPSATPDPPAEPAPNDRQQTEAGPETGASAGEV